MSLAKRDMPAEIDNYIVQLTEKVAEVGINRIRLETHSFFHKVEATNDNSDPLVINSKAFDFSVFDFEIDKVILPMRQAVAAKGEQLLINLCMVEVAANGDAFHKEPEEFAEFVLAHFLHLQDKYGWVPDFVEVSLEPTIFGTFDGSPAKLAKALVATGNRLKAQGFQPGFIAPSNTNMTKAINWFDGMLAVPNVFDYLTELSYHRYGTKTIPLLQEIAKRGLQHNINTSMLEWWSNGNTHHTLHEDLKIGNNSAWQQGTLGGLPPHYSNAYLFSVDLSNPQNPVLSIGPNTKFNRQYYKFVRQGAVRIEATGNATFDPLAFINADGRYVVVVKANAGGSFEIKKLPEATFGIKYTTPSDYDVDLPDVVVQTAGVLTTTIPRDGVITIYQKSIPQPPDTKAPSSPANLRLNP